MAPDLVANDRVVLAQHLEPAAVAEPLGHLGGALDVAEEHRHRPVGSGGAGQVGALVLDRLRHRVDRGADVSGVDPLELQPQRERALHHVPHPDLLGGLERLA